MPHHKHVWRRRRRIDSVCSIMVDAGHYMSVKTHSTHSTEWTLATDNTSAFGPGLLTKAPHPHKLLVTRGVRTSLLTFSVNLKLL